MTYLLIIFVIALALAPLAQVLPSKYQRRIARMREFAALQGMFVEFRTVPESPRVRTVESGYQKGKTIYYGLRIPARGCEVEQPLAWVHGEEGWHSLPRRVKVPSVLSDLPSGIIAVGIDHGSCGIFWQEAGDEADIERIYRVLCGLQDHFKN